MHDAADDDRDHPGGVQHLFRDDENQERRQKLEKRMQRDVVDSLFAQREPEPGHDQTENEAQDRSRNEHIGKIEDGFPQRKIARHDRRDRIVKGDQAGRVVDERFPPDEIQHLLRQMDSFGDPVHRDRVGGRQDRGKRKRGSKRDFGNEPVDKIAPADRRQENENDRVAENRGFHLPQLLAGKMPPVVVQERSDEQQQKPFRFDFQPDVRKREREREAESDLRQGRRNKGDVVADDVRNDETNEQQNDAHQETHLLPP